MGARKVGDCSSGDIARLDIVADDDADRASSNGRDEVERVEEDVAKQRVAHELRTLIDTANAPIFGIDKDGMVNEWNYSAADIVGYTAVEVMGRDLVAEFISPEYKQLVKEVLDNALQGKETANFELPIFTKDHKRVEMLLNATSRRDEAGNVVGVVGVGQDITERKQVELEKELVAHDLRTLIDTANAPIFGIDKAGLVNEWNQKAAKIVGYTSEEVMGRDLVAEFISPDYRESVKEVLDNALEGQETANFEFPLYTKEGGRVEVLLNATTRRDGFGKVVGVVGVGQDITERKQAELEKERVASDLRTLIDTANAPIFGINKAGLVNEWNQKAAEIVGYTSDEVMGRDLVAEFISPEYKQSVKEVLDNALQGTETANFEFPLFTKDRKKRVEILLNATSRRDEAGNVVGVVGVGQDITERKRVELEKEQVANDLRTLIDTANAPIFGIDKHGLVNEWNQMAADLVGYTSDEVMGRDLVAEFISPEYKKSVKEVLDNALRGKETANFEFPLFTRDRKKRVEILLNATTRRDGLGKVVGVVGVGQDITERKKVELEKSRVANDLRTLIDTANAPIFGINKAGLVNEWNQKAAEIVGYTSQEVMGRDLVAEFISPEYKKSVKEVLDNAIRGRETANFEFPLFTKDCKRVDILLNATTRRDESNRVVGVVGVGQDITERKQVELEKERVAIDLRTLIDTANAPIFGIDKAGLVNEWNNKAAEIVGYTSQEVMGRDLVAEFISPEYKKSVKEVLDNALQGQETANFEFPLYTKDQKRVDVLLNATSRKDEAGNVVGVVGVGQDITERKQVELEKERVANDLRTLIDTANAPIFGIDKAGLVNEWNQKAAEIVGYTSDEVMGRDLVAEFISPEYKKSVKEVLDNALRGTETANFEFPLYTKDQKRVDVLLNATTRRDESGSVVGVVGVGQDITERKQVELEKERVAIDLRTLIDTANAPIFGIDKDGLVNEWNHKAAEIVGYTADEVMGRDLISEFISPEYKKSVKVVLDNALRGKETANFEFPLFTKDQKRVEILLNATTRRDESGSVVGVVGVGQDITERKQVELEKERVANDLRTLIDTANAPIFGIDKDGLVNEWNQKAAEIVGYTSDEVMGRDLVSEFISPEYKKSVKEVLDNALRGTETANFEFPLFTKDQKRVEILLNATTRRDESGNVVGVVGVGQDITERKQVELEKEQVANDLRTLIDTANAPIFGIDKDGLVNEWNHKAAEIVGYMAAEVMGRDLVAEFISPEYKKSVKEVLDNALRGTETANFEFPLFTKDQKRVEILLNATTRRDESGKVVGVVGVGQDITERKQAELEKEQVANDLRSLIDTANAPIFGIDKDGLVNEWNHKAAEIVGYTSMEVMGRDLVAEFISPEYKKSVKEVLDNALRGQETANFEFPLYTKDQKRVDILLNATTRRDESGNVVGVVGVGQDITERKQVELEKERVAIDLRTLIDTANAPIFGIDKDGLVNEWNHKAAEIVMYTSDEVMGRDLVAEFISPEYRESVKEVLDNALRGIETANFEFPLFTKDQKRVDVLLNATTRRDESGSVVGVVGVGQDITERKQVELEKERVAIDLRTLIDTANAPIFGIDKDGLVNEWNHKAAEIVMYTSAEVMGRDLVAEFISPEYRESVKEVLDNALQGQETANFEFPLYTKDQKRVDVLLNATTRRDESGNVVGVVGVGQDITERKQAELEKERVANDLRTLIDTANAPIFGINKAGLVNEWNQKAAEIVGYTSKEVMGRDLVAEFISPDYRESVKEVLDNALEGQETANFEFPLYTKEGGRVEVLLNATTRRDGLGMVVGVVGVGQDITERKQAELEKEQVANDLRTLIDTANAPIFGIDKDGLVNEWNHKAAEIVGYTSMEVMGRDLVAEFISPEYKKSVKEVLDNALRGTETANFEFPLFTKDQKRVEILLNATTRRDESGNVVGVVGVGQDITERKQAELDKEQVANDLRTLIDTANAPIFGIDKDGLVNEWNQKAAEIVGYTSDEVMGRDLVAEFISPEYKKSVKEVLDNALQGQETANFEFPLFTKDQKRVEVLLNATTRRGPAGNVVGVVGVGQDITERKQAELEKDEVANDLRTLIDTANAPIFGIDKDGLVNEWNLKAAEIVGYTSQEVMGRDLVAEFISPEYKKSVKEVLDNALRGTETANFEFPLFTKDQKRVEVLLNATTRRDAVGNVAGVVGVGQDITERKQAELEKERVAYDLRTLIDTANAPIFGIDKDGLVNEWNQKAAEIVGYTSDEVMGRDLVAEFISPEYKKSVKEVLDNALRGTETANFEFPLYTKKQRRVEVLLNATTRRDASGQVVGVVGVGQDITEKRRAMEAEVALTKAKAANDAKSQFLANMSHEMRTPLNGILGINQVLLTTTLSPEQAQLAELIQSSSESLLKLINDILDLTRVESGKLELEPVRFNLLETVEDALDTVMVAAARKGLEVAEYVEPGFSTMLFGDSDRLKQVLLNLLSNAVKFTQSGEVVVSVEKDAAVAVDSDGKQIGLLFKVTDSGIGIPAEEQGKLFTRFTQVDGSTTRRYGGSGLGLAICKQLVELMGGAMGMQSNPSHGSTFWFTVTLDQLPVEDKPHTNLEEVSPVLVLAENDKERMVLLQYLRGWGIMAIVMNSYDELQSSLLCDTHCAKAVVLSIPANRGNEGDEDIAAIAELNSLVPEMMQNVILLSPMPLVARLADIRAPWQNVVKPAKRSSLEDALMNAGISRKDTVLPPLPNTAQDLASSPVFGPGSPPMGGLQNEADMERSSSDTIIVQKPLRILVADDNQANHIVLQKTLETVGNQLTNCRPCVVQAYDGTEAVQALADGLAFDMVLMDIHMPIMDGEVATSEIRKQYSLSALPVIALTATTNPVNSAPTLFNEVAMKPVSAEEMSDLIMSYVPRIESESLTNNRSSDESDTSRHRLSFGSSGGSSKEGLDVHILVADDNAANQTAIKRLVRKTGRQLLRREPNVRTVSDGREALDAMSRTRFDIVFMDIFMPIMNGLEALKAIRTKYTPQQLPVIAITGSDQSEIAWLEESSFNDVLLKPLDVNRLRDVMQYNVVDRRLRRPSFLRVDQPICPKKSIDPEGKTPDADIDQQRVKGKVSVGPPRPLAALKQALVDKQMTILVADGHPEGADDIKADLTVILKQLTGYDPAVDIISEGTEILPCVKGKKYDMVFMDINMPQMDGITAVRELRTLYPAKESLPVVALTDCEDPLLARRSTQQLLGVTGFNEVDIKPVPRTWLRQILIEHCECFSDHRAELAIEAASLPLQPLQVPEENGRGLTCLVVEDDGVSMMMMTKLLKDADMTMIPVDNGVEAIAAFMQRKIDVILMDCNMPIKDGWQATRSIRAFEAEHNVRRTPIIGVTANAMKGDREYCLSCGMDDYLTKPVQKSLLIDTINKWVKPASDEDISSQQDPADMCPPAVPPQQVSTPVDLEHMLELFDGDWVFVMSLLECFIDTGRDQVLEMIDAGQRCDVGRVKFLAHTLRGAARSCGIEGGAEVFGELEDLCASHIGSEANFIPLSEEEKQLINVLCNLCHRLYLDIASFGAWISNLKAVNLAGGLEEANGDYQTLISTLSNAVQQARSLLKAGCADAQQVVQSLLNTPYMATTAVALSADAAVPVHEEAPSVDTSNTDREVSRRSIKALLGALTLELDGLRGAYSPHRLI